MKYIILILSALTIAGRAATSVQLNIDSLELSSTDTTTSTASVINTSGNTITTSYMYTSDFDGRGGDDTLAFDVIATYTGVNDQAEIGTTTNALNYDIKLGQTITFTLANLTYTRANGLSNDVTFNGFYSISVGGPLFGDFSSSVTGDSYLDIAGTLNSIDLDTNYPSLDVTLDAVSDTAISADLAEGSKVFRRPDANFTIETTVPEPTTTMLLGLGVMSLLSRRHR